MKKIGLEKARYWQDHVEAQATSQLNKQVYCRQHSLAYSQFLYWMRKHTKKKPSLIRQLRENPSVLLTSTLNMNNTINKE